MTAGQMLEVTAGLENQIVRPILRYALLGTKMPDRNKAFGAPWPTGWKRIPRTVNGLGITYTNPKQDFVCDEEGPYDSISSGGEAVNLAFQSRTPNMELLKLISGLVRDELAASAEYKKTYLYDLDSEENNEFMLGWEGKLAANSAFDEEVMVFGVAWRCEATSNPQWRAAKTGTDAANAPTADLRAFPYTVPAAQCGLGFDPALMASRKRRVTQIIMPTAPLV